MNYPRQSWIGRTRRQQAAGVAPGDDPLAEVADAISLLEDRGAPVEELKKWFASLSGGKTPPPASADPANEAARRARRARIGLEPAGAPIRREGNKLVLAPMTREQAAEYRMKRGAR
jgi:hypothetical protein